MRALLFDTIGKQWEATQANLSRSDRHESAACQIFTALLDNVPQ